MLTRDLFAVANLLVHRFIFRMIFTLRLLLSVKRHVFSFLMLPTVLIAVNKDFQYCSLFYLAGYFH